MRSRQRECRVVVIKGRGRPSGRVVALRTVGRESRSHVIRIIRSCEILLMASVARRRQRSVVGARARVALHALHGRVGSCQREPGRAVVKRRRSPVGRAVAHRAIRWESGSSMRRVCRPRKVLLMAPIAVRRQRAGIVVVRMALCTGHRRMRASQRERGRVVVKRRRSPVRSAVALCAIGREP